MARSRFSRVQENQSKKSIFLSILGIAVVLFLVFKFGLPFIIGVTSFVSTTRSDNDTSLGGQKSFVAIPVLNSLPDATNKNTITISGSGPSDLTIILYINNEKKDQTTSDESGSFSFADVTLDKGSNSIQTKAVTKDGSESQLSDPMTVAYSDTKPSLSLDHPSDSEAFSKDQNSITVNGKTDPGVKITINDLWAIVDDAGNYTYNLPLKSGDNEIKIVATDDAGNTTDKTIKVTYSP